MIFFVADQVAGAEYILPFLLARRDEPGADHHVFAGTVAGSVLARHALSFELVEEMDPERVEACFDQMAPSLCILSATGESVLERLFVTLAHKRGIRTVQFIDNWLNYRSRFSLAGVEIFPQHILTLDQKARAAMVAEGIPPQIISVVGQPYFEYKANPDPGSTDGGRITLVTQPVSRFYGTSLGYDETSFVTQALSAALAAGIDASDIDLRIHPSEEEAMYRFLLDSLSVPEATRVGIVREGSLAGNRAVLGMFSSVLVHAVLKDLPVASFQPDPIGDDKCFLSALGYIPRITTGSGLVAFFRCPVPSAGALEFTDVIRGSSARFADWISAKRFVQD